MSWSPRRSRIGVGIAANAVRAVELAGGEIVWTCEVALTDERPLSDALRALLAARPGPRWPRPAVSVAVGATHAQLRRLRGLPPVRNKRLLASVVQQGVTRYFVQNGTPVLTTGVATGDRGDAWAGAIEQPTVQDAADSCRACGFTLVAVAPTAAVLGHAFEDGVIEWCDGGVRLLVAGRDDQLRECRRIPDSVVIDRAPDRPARPVPALRALPDGGVRFADAYAAANISPRSALTLPLAHSGARLAAPVPPARMAIAALACALSLGLAAAAPGISATRHERDARRRLAGVTATAQEALRAERALEHQARLLGELATFAGSVSSPTLLLASLTEALESPTMLVSLRLDGAGGVLTALTPSTAALLAMLDAVPEIEGAVITGSVTPEPVMTEGIPISGPAGVPPGAPPGPPASLPPGVTPGTPYAQPQPPGPGDRLERVTVRFRWRGAPRVSSPVSGGDAR